VPTYTIQTPRRPSARDSCAPPPPLKTPSNCLAMLYCAQATRRVTFTKEHNAVDFSYDSQQIIFSSFSIYALQLPKQTSSFLACCFVTHYCKNVHLQGTVLRVLSPPPSPPKVCVLSFGGNILSPLITPPQLFLIEERLSPLSETLFRPHFSAKKKRCVHKRGLKERKGRTLQTKII